MADDVQYTLNADSTPPAGTLAATDETTSGPHTAGAHMGIAKLAVSANGDSTHVPATAADGLLVEVSNPTTAVNATIVAPIGADGGIAVEAAGATGLGVTVVGGGTASRTAVNDSATDVQLLSAVPGRKEFSVFNDSSATLYIAFGVAAATLSDYTVQVPANSFFSDDLYRGEVRGIWDSDPGDGAAHITEVTT